MKEIRILRSGFADARGDADLEVMGSASATCGHLVELPCPIGKVSRARPWATQVILSQMRRSAGRGILRKSGRSAPAVIRSKSESQSRSPGG